MHLMTINGKPVLATVTEPQGQTYSVCAVEAAHSLWANLLDITDRFESGTPIASAGKRNQLAQLADDMVVQLPAIWDKRGEQKQMVGIALNRFVRLEEELERFAAERPLDEDFAGLVTWDGWAHERLSGDDDELQQSADEARAEATQLRFELHRQRKTTANRIELAKLGLVPRFSWKQAWAETVSAMRELGAEARKSDAWANACERELRIRIAERREDGRAVTRWFTSDMDGATECETDYDWPTEYDECRRLAREQGR